MGVGPEKGLGATLCKRFAERELHIFLAGRTQDKVQAVAESIRSVGGVGTAVPTDATDEDAVTKLFDKANDAGPISLAVFNAGNNMPGRIRTMDAAYFEAAWRVGCYGGFLFAREAVRLMEPRGEGTIIVTGASASLRGNPNFGAFAAAKAGLRAMTQSLAKECGPLGIHVGHVLIDGPIDGERIRKLNPDAFQERGSDRLIDLHGIASAYEFLYDQPRRAWTHELDLRTFKERF